MPQQGSLTNTAMGDFPFIPDQYQSAMQAGLAFFELRLPRSIKYDQRIYGPYDVSVSEDVIPGQTRVFYNATWKTAGNAMTLFERASKRGLGLGFMVDDPWWHNRLIIMDNPLLFAAMYRYHGNQGNLTAGEIRTEINCLRKILCEEKPIIRVFHKDKNREVDFFYTEEDADYFISEHPKVRFVKQEGTKLEKTSEVEVLIKKYGRGKYGWTECLEFKERIRPEVEQLIKKEREIYTEKGGAVNSQDIINAIKDLTLEQRKDILEVAKEAEEEDGFGDVDLSGSTGQQLPPPPEAPDEDLLGEATGAKPVENVLTKTKLNKMNLAKLQEVCIKNDIDFDGKKKSSLVTEICERLQIGVPAGEEVT